MALKITPLCLLSICVFCGFSPLRDLKAQISNDGTLSTTVSTDDAVNFLIENGDRSGNNLFHSFSEFSIPDLGSAYFNNATDITNIFSRVTGGNISEIQGLIRANGTANLFLINPAGIVFGENASLDVGGSFFAATAESVVFGDGIEFSAVEPQEAPLLTVNITPGLQMGANPGDITVRGNGHTQIYPQGTNIPFDRINSTRGLEVSTGQTIGLVGGNIFFESGVLTAENGTIELVSVGDNSTLIELNLTDSGKQLGYESITNFGNIQLDERSLIDASGINGGSIYLQAQQIELLNASTLLIQNVGNQNAGIIQVNATEALVMGGNSLEGLAVSLLRSETLGSGRGANIAVETQHLTITDGAQLGARTFGVASGGDVNVIATQRIDARGFATGNPFINSGIGTETFGNVGNAGDVLIYTGQLSSLDGGSFASTSAGIGAGGRVTVNATESVELSGINPFALIPANVGVFAIGSGDAGKVEINTPKVIITNGGQISSSTLTSATAGDIVINASEFVEVKGLFVSDAVIRPSAISASSDIGDSISRQVFGLPPFPTGESGNLNINTPILRVLNGATVSVRNDGTSGNAGSLEINADSVFLNNQGNLSATARDGQGGNINVTINSLDLSDRATISVSSLGSGKAGNLTIDANSISLDSQSSLQAEVSAGNQGNISLNSQLLLLRNNSNITTNAGNLANGGNITIDTINLVTLENSNISANAVQGRGGNIIINAQGLFLSLDSNITASSEFGVDGVVEINTPDEENKLAIAELPADLTDASQQIVGNCSWTRDNTFYVTGRSGIAKTPQEHLEIYQMWSDIRDLSGNQSSVISGENPRRRQTQGNAHQESHQSSPKPERIIEANAWIINENGNVELVAVVPSNNQNLGQVASSCSGEVGS